MSFLPVDVLVCLRPLKTTNRHMRIHSESVCGEVVFPLHLDCWNSEASRGERPCSLLSVRKQCESRDLSNNAVECASFFVHVRVVRRCFLDLLDSGAANDVSHFL